MVGADGGSGALPTGRAIARRSIASNLKVPCSERRRVIASSDVSESRTQLSITIALCCEEEVPPER